MENSTLEILDILNKINNRLGNLEAGQAEVKADITSLKAEHQVFSTRLTAVQTEVENGVRNITNLLIEAQKDTHNKVKEMEPEVKKIQPLKDVVEIMGIVTGEHSDSIKKNTERIDGLERKQAAV